ncbi:MAG TPA: serpin family protein [Polyangiales bacterium]|nr:serpin family protein [Polyangiales bacterium]
MSRTLLALACCAALGCQTSEVSGPEAASAAGTGPGAAGAADVPRTPPAADGGKGGAGASAPKPAGNASAPKPPASGGAPAMPATSQTGLSRSSISADTAPAVGDADYATFIAHLNEFGLDLGQAMAPGNDLTKSNLIYSPLSAAVALHMTYAGAKGRTAEEMKTVLGDSFAPGVFHTASNKLARELKSRVTSRPDSGGNVHKIELNLVDALWVDRTVVLQDAFLDVLSRDYDSGVTKVDFIHAFEPARMDINAWVAKQTKDRIQDLLPQGSITDLTRLVLVNALYFYGSWLTPFVHDLTRDEDFTPLSGAAKRVPTMHAELRLPYRMGDGLEVAELPYEGNALRMTVVLPAPGRFEAVRAQISAAWLDQTVANLQPKLLSVSLPKFKLTVGSFSLKAGLQALGMEQAFTDQADFSGITSSTSCSISDVVQKAFIAVDENGTEAAAATGVIVGTTSVPVDPPVPFKVDRPFIFFIRDTSGTVLFSGQVVDPGQ